MPAIPGDCVAGNRGAHFVRPCPVALRRNKALHLTAQPSNLRFAAYSVGERRDSGNRERMGPNDHNSTCQMLIC